MKQLHGDLIQMANNGAFDVIVHGCNCHHFMGAGIAKQIRVFYPEAYEADKYTPTGSHKLGNISYAKHGNLIVVNAYTQDQPGPFAQLDAIKRAFENIKLNFHGLRIGYPMIGCGIGGLDWKEVAEAINEIMEGEDHTCVIYEPTRRK